MKIIIAGFKGKTGSVVYKMLKDEGYDVVGFEIEDGKLKDKKFDLLIDFTTQDVAYQNMLTCIEKKKNFICGTTGFNSLQLATLKSLCNQNNVNGTICYNFSCPINEILKSIPSLSNYFTDITYFDIHHISKKDKVSGTTYLFMLKNNKIKVCEKKTSKNTITYNITLQTKYDRMNISYMVYDRIVFAKGLLLYLQGKNDIINMLGEI